MELLEPIQQYRKLLLREPKAVSTIRASTLASYWYCSEKARLQALGVEEAESNAVMAAGTAVHDAILMARQPSPLELELQQALAPFLKDGVISRTYRNTKIKADGEFVTHGADGWKVAPDRKCWILEYKTKASPYISPIDLSPARFQNKLYLWLYHPIFSLIPFTLAGGQIIFLKRVGTQGDFEEIGQTEQMFWNEDAEATLLEDIEHILWCWNNPTKQIPCKSWKCLHCPPIYKKKCIFQTNELWSPENEEIAL